MIRSEILLMECDGHDQNFWGESRPQATSDENSHGNIADYQLNPLDDEVSSSSASLYALTTMIWPHEDSSNASSLLQALCKGCQVIYRLLPERLRLAPLPKRWGIGSVWDLHWNLLIFWPLVINLGWKSIELNEGLWQDPTSWKLVSFTFMYR